MFYQDQSWSINSDDINLHLSITLILSFNFMYANILHTLRLIEHYKLEIENFYRYLQIDYFFN